MVSTSSADSNSAKSLNHSPAPDRSQCSRVAPHCACTRTGTPTVSASTTVRENDSCGEGATAARAPRNRAHLVASSTMPVNTTSAAASGAFTTCPMNTNVNGPGWRSL